MSLKLANFQLLWGVAGAREKFEEMVSQLIHVERPDSQRIRIVVGDGGLDSFEGDLSDPAGIDVYQVKYFPDRLEDSQKQQIRSSFATVRDGKKFKVKSWTLCLPIDMSVDETEWFEGWSAKQADSGIDIRKPWGALHIEGLLLQDKNRAIRESFFREENTELLRAQVGHLESILAELKQRGDRNLKVRINPVWNGNRLQAQVQLFNSGNGAIYIDSWWTQWGLDGKKGGSRSAETFQGTLPVRLEEHDAAELLISIECDVEALSGIGVFDGDQHLWLATGAILLMRANWADSSEALGNPLGVGVGEKGRPVAERLFLGDKFPQERTPMNYSICLAALLTSQVQRLLAEAQETLLPGLQQIVELVVSFFAGRDHARGGAAIRT